MKNDILFQVCLTVLKVKIPIKMYVGF